MAIDFGASLDKILGAYTQVSQVRSQVDLAKYNAVAANQQALLNAPEAVNARESYATGNAQNPYVMPGNAGMGSVPPAVIYGGFALAGIALLMMARR
jgi:hypothetical protein